MELFDPINAIRGNGLLDSSIVPSRNLIFHHLSRSPWHLEDFFVVELRAIPVDCSAFGRIPPLCNRTWWSCRHCYGSLVLFCGLRLQRTSWSSYLNIYIYLNLNHVNVVKIWFMHHLGTKATSENKNFKSLNGGPLLEIFPLACAKTLDMSNSWVAPSRKTQSMSLDHPHPCSEGE